VGAHAIAGICESTDTAAARKGTLVNATLLRLTVFCQARDRGQTMAEYAVVLGIISVGILVALGALTGSIGGQLNRVTSDL
jgi:Flp pilus assembly pilin Flp